MKDLSTIFNFFCGRATTFAIVFATVGIIQTFRGHLDATFIAFVTTIQGLVFAHSWKEDVMDQRAAEATDPPKGQ